MIPIAGRCMQVGEINTSSHRDEVCRYLFSHLLTEYIIQGIDLASLSPPTLLPLSFTGSLEHTDIFLFPIFPFCLAGLSRTPARAGDLSHKGLPSLSCQGGDVIWSIFFSFINNKTPVSEGVEEFLSSSFMNLPPCCGTYLSASSTWHNSSRSEIKDFCLQQKGFGQRGQEVRRKQCQSLKAQPWLAKTVASLDISPFLSLALHCTLALKENNTGGGGGEQTHTLMTQGLQLRSLTSLHVIPCKLSLPVRIQCK